MSLRSSLYGFGLRVLGAMPEPVSDVVGRVASTSFHLGAACLIVDDDGRWLVVGHTYRTGWGLPGGRLNGTEDPADTAVREMREELGIEVTLDEPLVLIERERRSVVFVYPTTIVDGGPPEPVSVELTEVRWVHPDELDEPDSWLERIRPLAAEHLVGGGGSTVVALGPRRNR